MQTMHRQTEAISSPCLVKVELEHLHIMWPLVVRWIDEAQASSRYASTIDVFNAIVSREAQLWVVWNNHKPGAVIVTQLHNSSKGKYCGIWICVGEGRIDTQHLISELEQWAKSEGCAFMRHEARPGWSRVLKAYGYEMPHVILEKDL